MHSTTIWLQAKQSELYDWNPEQVSSKNSEHGTPSGRCHNDRQVISSPLEFMNSSVRAT